MVENILLNSDNTVVGASKCIFGLSVEKRLTQWWYRHPIVERVGHSKKGLVWLDVSSTAPQTAKNTDVH